MNTLFQSVYSNLSDVIHSTPFFCPDKKYKIYFLLPLEAEEVCQKRVFCMKENSWDDYIISFDNFCQERGWDNVVVEKMEAVNG